MSELSRVARRWRWNWFDSGRKSKNEPKTHLHPVHIDDTPPAVPSVPDGGEAATEVRAHVSLFDKCRRYTKAKEVQAAGLYPYFRTISDSEDTVVVMEGRKRIMLRSNNYLGLTHHPKVLEAAETALRRYGSGCTGSRFLNGTLDLHCKLEEAIADFIGKERCLVFSTGYMANVGLIAGLVSRRDVIYLDKLDHASIVDGANLAFGEVQRFNHGELDELDRKMSSDPSDRGQLIMVDGV